MPCTVTVVNRVLLYTYAPRSAADAHAVVAEISAAFLGRDGVSMVSASMPNGRPHVFVVVDGPMDTVSSRLPSAVNGIPVIAVQRAAVAPQTPAGEVKSKELLASVSSATKGGYKLLKPAATPDDADINYIINPFAMTPGGAADVGSRGWSLNRVANSLNLSLGELLNDKSSPMRKNSIDKSAKSAVKRAQSDDGASPTAWRMIDPPRVGDPRLDPWDPPVDPARRNYTIVRSAWDYVAPMFDGPPSFADVAQGGVPNCNFLASLASVALSMPSVLVERATPAASPRGERLRQIRLSSGDGINQVLISERVPRYVIRDGSDDAIGGAGSRQESSSRTLLPCAQNTWSMQGELFKAWPAVYEKACARIGLGVAHDRPNLMLPNYWIPGGWDELGQPTDTVHPITGLTGIPTMRVDAMPMNENDIWSFVMERMIGDVARLPMICSAAASETFSTAEWERIRLVPDHAYSVLGAIEADRHRYIVLRNPWGIYQPDATATIGGRWHGEVLGQRGLFAYELSQFKAHFGSTRLCRFYAASNDRASS